MSRFRQFLLSTAAVAVMFAAEQPPKELVTYIEDARRLGLADDRIRKNMAAAGWDSRLVDDAFASAAVGQPAAETAASAGVPDGYRIGSGDVVQIAVWHEPDASVPS